MRGTQGRRSAQECSGQKLAYPKCVGYALLNLFHDAGDDAAQPKDAHAQGHCLNAGAVQLPIYRKPPRVADLAHDQLDGKPRVAAATLLVRVQVAPTTPDGLEVLSRNTAPEHRWAALGLASPAPAYASGAYDSKRCAPSPLERELYRRRFKRSDPGVARSGHVADAVAATTFAARGSDERALLDRAAEFAAAALRPKPTAILPHTRQSSYEADLGLSVAVDGLNNLPSSKHDPPSLYKVVTVISPPGLYLRDPPLAEDAQFTLKHDLDAWPQHPRFLDGPRRFRDKPRSPSLAAFFEIRPAHAADDRKRGGLVADVPTSPSRRYWAVLPLFQRPTRPSAFLRRCDYVDSGAFVLPLFRGTIPATVLAAAHAGDCVVDALAEIAAAAPRKRRKGAPPPDFDLVPGGASLLVRVVDAQLDDLRDFAPPTRPEYATSAAIAAGADPQAYSFNYAIANPKDKKSAKRLLPKKHEPGDVVALLNREFAEATGIRHYRL